MSSLTEFFEASKSYTPSESSVRKKVEWEQSASKYLAKKPSVRRGMWVKPDPDVDQMIANVLSDACPLIAEPFNETLGKLALEAFKQWPVESGLSKSLIDLEYKTTETEVRGVLRCTAPYAYMIREKQNKQKISQAKRSADKSSSKTSAWKKSDWIAVAKNPPKYLDARIWAAAVWRLSRRGQGLQDYAYASATVVYQRIEGNTKKIDAYYKGYEAELRGLGPVEADKIAKAAETKGRRKNKGKLIAKKLIFDKADEVGEQLARKISEALAREFGK
jgi:hypothetical protein